MNIHNLHSWQLSPAEARNVQEQLRSDLIFKQPFTLNEIKTVAAADISFSRFEKDLYAVVVVVNFPDLEPRLIKTSTMRVDFPYIPGLLSFRETPVILNIFRELPSAPDILLCDGHGISHPRGCGFASHLGLLLDISTIGCAKSVLVGEFREPSFEKGAFSHLMWGGEIVGAALRTRSRVKPVFVSIGHRMTLSLAMEVVLRCSPRFRIPEPLRLAHRKVNELRRCSESRAQP